MALCYMNLQMYEDALEYCNIALKIDTNHVLSLYSKAKSLAFLFEFDKSIEIFKRINLNN